MSVTLANLRYRVRERIRETDARRVAFDPVEIDQAIADAYLENMAQLKPPALYTENALTIAANARTFSLPATVPAGYISTAQYDGDVRIQLASSAVFLERRSREELEALHNGDTSTQGRQAPSLFALYEDEAQIAQGLLWPRSRAAELCHLYRTLVADDLRDHTTSIESATIMMSRFGVQALVGYTAADLLDRMTDEDLALRRLSRTAAARWLMRADRMIYLEEARQNRLSAIAYVQRRVG